jgi:pilus assembly protein Flp/PilA
MPARGTIKEERLWAFWLQDFFWDESAATAIEYGLIAAGISIAIIAAVAALGTSLNTTFTSVSTALK